MLCKDCENHYIRSPQRFRFHDKKVLDPGFVRNRVCSWCGCITAQRYVRHHMEYDEADEKAHTVEICQSCHAKEHNKNRLRNMLGQFVT